MSTELTKIFTKEFNEALVHQITTDYMANQRKGTKAQKFNVETVPRTLARWRTASPGLDNAASTAGGPPTAAAP